MMRQHLLWLALGASACTSSTEKDSWTLPVPEPAPEPADDSNADTAIVDSGSSDDTDQTDTSIEDTSSDTGEAGDTDTSTGDTGEDTGEGPIDPVMVYDFNLPDINTVSNAFGQTISPRDYIEQATGWYFIKAT